MANGIMLIASLWYNQCANKLLPIDKRHDRFGNVFAVYLPLARARLTITEHRISTISRNVYGNRVSASLAIQLIENNSL